MHRPLVNWLPHPIYFGFLALGGGEVSCFLFMVLILNHDSDLLLQLVVSEMYHFDLLELMLEVAKMIIQMKVLLGHLNGPSVQGLPPVRFLSLQQVQNFDC